MKERQAKRLHEAKNNNSGNSNKKLVKAASISSSEDRSVNNSEKYRDRDRRRRSDSGKIYSTSDQKIHRVRSYFDEYSGSESRQTSAKVDLEVKLQLIEISGETPKMSQNRFRAKGRADAVMLVYDVTEQDSFNSLERRWIKVRLIGISLRVRSEILF